MHNSFPSNQHTVAYRKFYYVKEEKQILYIFFFYVSVYKIKDAVGRNIMTHEYYLINHHSFSFYIF